MFKLPFSWYPYTWGTSGKTREILEAEYKFSGMALEMELLEINKKDYDKDTYTTKKWDIQLKYGHINEQTYHDNLITLIKDEKQKTLAVLEVDRRKGKVTELEYAKQTATLHDEPWVNCMSMEFGGKTALEGSFELDWNDQFVDKLREAGYTGHTPDVIVNQWFMEVCRNIALEEFDGTGNFTPDSEANLDAVKRWSDDSKGLPAGKKGYR